MGPATSEIPHPSTFPENANMHLFSKFRADKRKKPAVDEENQPPNVINAPTGLDDTTDKLKTQPTRSNSKWPKPIINSLTEPPTAELGEPEQDFDRKVAQKQLFFR
jgi:hypothetical protein